MSLTPEILVMCLGLQHFDPWVRMHHRGLGASTMEHDTLLEVTAAQSLLDMTSMLTAARSELK